VLACWLIGVCSVHIWHRRHPHSSSYDEWHALDGSALGCSLGSESALVERL
jgi:hypothetical protein